MPARIDARYRALVQLRAVSAEEYRAIGCACVDNDAWRTADEAIAPGLATCRRDAIQAYATIRLSRAAAPAPSREGSGMAPAFAVPGIPAAPPCPGVPGLWSSFRAPCLFVRGMLVVWWRNGPAEERPGGHRHTPAAVLPPGRTSSGGAR
jgi:hypothetical protein